jgi:hypothetical protein
LRRYRWWERGEESIPWFQLASEIRSGTRCPPGNRIYYACRLGLLEAAELCDEDPNGPGGPKSYPLLAALEDNHIGIAEMFVTTRGAQVGEAPRAMQVGTEAEGEGEWQVDS